MVQQAVTVKNGMGLHARPAAMIIKQASQYQADIRLVKGDRDVDAKSIMGILTLAVKQGEEVVVRAQGEDAEEAVRNLVTLVKTGLE